MVKIQSTYSGKNGHTHSKTKSRVLFRIQTTKDVSNTATADTWVIAFTYPNKMPPVRLPMECHMFLKENRLHLKCSCLNDPLFPAFTSMASYAHGPLTGIVSQILIYPAASIGSLDQFTLQVLITREGYCSALCCLTWVYEALGLYGCGWAFVQGAGSKLKPGAGFPLSVASLGSLWGCLMSCQSGGGRGRS